MALLSLVLSITVLSEAFRLSVQIINLAHGLRRI